MKKVILAALIATSALQIHGFPLYDSVQTAYNDAQLLVNETASRLSKNNAENHAGCAGCTTRELPTGTALGHAMDYIRSFEYDNAEGLNLRSYAQGACTQLNDWKNKMLSTVKATAPEKEVEIIAANINSASEDSIETGTLFANESHN